MGLGGIQLPPPYIYTTLQKEYAGDHFRETE